MAMKHLADLAAADREIERIEVRQKKLVESIMFPASEVKDELNAYALRREALKGLAVKVKHVVHHAALCTRVIGER